MIAERRCPKVDDERLALARFGRAEPGVFEKRLSARRQCVVGHVQIDEAGTCDLDFGENRQRLETRGDFFGDRTRIGLSFFGRCKRAVALELGKVGPGRTRHLSERLRKSFGRERICGDRAQLGAERDHGTKRPIFLL